MRRRFGRGRGGPGLLATVARTAVVAGTATAVSGRVASMQERLSAPPPAPPPAPVPPPLPPPTPPAPPRAAVSVDDLHAQLLKLAELKQAGLLTEGEFAQQKSRLLGS
ncbi:SHOCT domain-containing protein [Pseudonocardia lacus]|uniref:SHOCT domain-containing protein n=1 Tax=Pseudonocardia lacus TaxID=2835865 RepID=UPI001BDD840D|nr:SHOCT domain-containing protein [Pseudonocardia lacus]